MATTAYGWDSFFSTTLAASASASDTTLQLVAAPTATEGVLVLEPNSSTNREIIYYTGVVGNSVTLPSVGAGRGQEGTTAVAHSSGVVVKRNTTSRDFEVLKDGTALNDNAITASKLATSAITLGYAEITSNVGSLANASGAFVTGLTSTVTIPAGGRRVKITAYVSNVSSNDNSQFDLQIWDGTVGSGTKLNYSQAKNRVLGDSAGFMTTFAIVTPSAGSKTYNVGMACNTGVATVVASSTSPAFILVEAI